MTRSIVSLCRPLALLCASLALGLSGPALAQAAGDYRDFRLPSRPTTAAPVAGPADDSVPAPRTSTSAPAPSQPEPVISQPPATSPTARSPAPRTAPPIAAPPARPSSPVGTAVTPAPSPVPLAVPTTSAGSAFPTPPTDQPASAPGAAAPTVPATAPERGVPWWAYAVAALLAALAGAFAWSMLRRRAEAQALAEPVFVRPQVPPADTPATAETPQAPAIARGPIALALEVTRMSATLMNATLSYRLTLANTGPAPLADLTVSGDMIAAHASVPQERLIDAGNAPLPPLHKVSVLAPGEQVTLTGDIRLPLAAIVPIHRGEARLFVPLARFRTSGTGNGEAMTEHSAFLIGQEPQARAKLQPFRLDLGPRLYSQVGQRPIVLAA